MAVSPARRAAFDVLFRVETRDSYAVELLHSGLLDRLSTSDRALATELVMGVLRWQRVLDLRLERAAGRSLAKFDAEVKLALRLGSYQLLSLDRIPARAAVHESVELVKAHGKRSAAPLVNAVLRKISSSRSSSDENESLALAERLSHPDWLVERWSKRYGDAVAQSICEYDQQRPTTTIRLDNAADLQQLHKEGVQLEPAEMVSGAFHVTQGDITATTLYAQRRVVVQDEGSQLVALLARGAKILDCCAAPGGKSALASIRNADALVVSMDLHVHRARLMRELTRSPFIVCADACVLPFCTRFDCVIADLPCTGTGTIARNPEIKWRLRPEDLPRLANLQFEILDSVSSVADTVVFSTCSLESEEGEQVVERFLSAHPEFRIRPILERLQELATEGALNEKRIDSLLSGAYLRTIPGIHSCDGFFAAMLVRA